MTSKTRLILLLGALASLGPLSIDMYLPSFPDIASDLHTTSARVSGTVASFFVGLCLGQLVYGPLSDRIGRKRPLLAGILIYLAGSLGCFLAPDIDALTAARFLQALGACAGIVIGRAIVRDHFEPAECSRVFSLIMLTLGVSPILAPVAGQFLADLSGWRGIFGVMVLFGSLVWAAVYRFIPADPPGDSELPTRPLLERFASVLNDPNFLTYTLAGTLIQAGLYAYISGSSHLFMGQLGLSPKAFSLLFGVNAAGLILASQVNSRLLQRYHYRTILERALQVACGASVLLGLMALLHWHTLAVTLPLALFLATLGLVFPNSTAGALERQGHQAGTASALIGCIQYGGAAVSSSIVAALHPYTDAPMQLTIAGCGILSLVAFRTLSRRLAPHE